MISNLRNKEFKVNNYKEMIYREMTGCQGGCLILLEVPQVPQVPKLLFGELYLFYRDKSHCPPCYIQQ